MQDPRTVYASVMPSGAQIFLRLAQNRQIIQIYNYFWIVDAMYVLQQLQ